MRNPESSRHNKPKDVPSVKRKDSVVKKLTRAAGLTPDDFKPLSAEQTKEMEAKKIENKPPRIKEWLLPKPAELAKGVDDALEKSEKSAPGNYRESELGKLMSGIDATEFNDLLKYYKENEPFKLKKILKSRIFRGAVGPDKRSAMTAASVELANNPEAKAAVANMNKPPEPKPSEEKVRTAVEALKTGYKKKEEEVFRDDVATDDTFGEKGKLSSVKNALTAMDDATLRGVLESLGAGEKPDVGKDTELGMFLNSRVIEGMSYGQRHIVKKFLEKYPSLSATYEKHMDRVFTEKHKESMESLRGALEAKDNGDAIKDVLESYQSGDEEKLEVLRSFLYKKPDKKPEEEPSRKIKIIEKLDEYVPFFSYQPFFRGKPEEEPDKKVIEKLAEDEYKNQRKIIGEFLKQLGNEKLVSEYNRRAEYAEEDRKKEKEQKSNGSFWELRRSPVVDAYKGVKEGFGKLFSDTSKDAEVDKTQENKKNNSTGSASPQSFGGVKQLIKDGLITARDKITTSLWPLVARGAESVEDFLYRHNLYKSESKLLEAAALRATLAKGLIDDSGVTVESMHYLKSLHADDGEFADLLKEMKSQTEQGGGTGDKTGVYLDRILKLTKGGLLNAEQIEWLLKNKNKDKSGLGEKGIERLREEAVSAGHVIAGYIS